MLAEARYQSARELFDEAWLLYTRKGLSDNGIYTLSVRLLTAQLDSAAKPAARIAACQEHLDRMQKMQSMIAKVRELGYSKKLELKEIDYFVHEARYWLRANRRNNPSRQRSSPFAPATKMACDRPVMRSRRFCMRSRAEPH